MSYRALTAVALSAALASQCAGVRAVQSGQALQGAPTTRSNASLVLAAAERITPGSRVKLMVEDGRRLNAVLVGIDGSAVIVRERTRVPEPPLRLAAGDIAWIELDPPRSGIGKMIAIGAAIGTGVTLAFLAMLAATLDD